MASVGTIISYCTNDYRFIHKCIDEARKFSNQIIVPVCDHLFDGTPENRCLLNWTYAANPDCLFIEFAYLTDRIYSRFHRMTPIDDDWAIYWAATARHIGVQYLNPDIDWVFFLDSDEIAEGEKFHQWLQASQSLDFDAQRLGAHLYVLRPTLRAKRVVNLPLLVKKSTFKSTTLLDPLERIGAFLSHSGPKREQVLSLQGKPMIHHYTWVRTKEECIRKGETWSHRNDADWKSIIESSFQETSRQLFLLPHDFEEIPEPYYDPLQIELPTTPPPETDFPNVVRITESDFFRKELEPLLT